MAPSDHDLLIRIDERVQKLDRCMRNHLHHHFLLTLAAASAAVAAFGSLIVSLVVR